MFFSIVANLEISEYTGYDPVLNNINDPIMTLLVTCRNHPSILTIRDYGKGRRNSTK